jgi:hypothetical protein
VWVAFDFFCFHCRVRTEKCERVERKRRQGKEGNGDLLLVRRNSGTRLGVYVTVGICVGPRYFL